MHEVIKTPQAIFDLVELADYIAKDSLDFAERFLQAAEDTFTFLAQTPEFGQICPAPKAKEAGIRMRAVFGFRNHIVFYRAVAQGVVVVRVIHAARNWEAILGDVGE